MILLNFGSRLQKMAFEQITAISGLKITEQVMLPLESSGADVIAEMDKLFAKVKLTGEELRSDRLVVLPSSSPVVTTLVILELKKRTGQFPYLVITRPTLVSFRLGADISTVLDLEKEFGISE